MTEKVNKTFGTASSGQAASDYNLISVRSPWMSNWRLPGFLRRMMPGKVNSALSELKGRVLTRDLPRHIEFEQSLEDALASASMSVVVPIHDAPIVVRRCLASLEKYAPESEIVLVDDASSLTETLDLIRYFSDRNGWKVVHNEKPLGHSEACRAGARFATRPYLCLLNSDTVVTPWCWRRINEVFEHDSQIGVAGPSSSRAGIQTIPLAASLRFYWNDDQIHAFANRLLSECAEPVVVNAAWVEGFAFFIRRSLWKQVGGFDKNLPDYGNEEELCKRVAKKGYRMVWVRNSYIHHFGQQSYGSTIGVEGIRARIRDTQVYMQERDHSLVS